MAFAECLRLGPTLIDQQGTDGIDQMPARPDKLGGHVEKIGGPIRVKCFEGIGKGAIAEI